MEIPVTICTRNPTLANDLFEVHTESELQGRPNPTEHQVTDGFRIRYDHVELQAALGAGEILQITLILERLAEDVLAGLVTAWLLRKLTRESSQVTSLQIDRVTVELREDEIRRVILERIRARTH